MTQYRCPMCGQTFEKAQATGCAGCMMAVQNEMEEVVRQFREALGGQPFLGLHTFGEQGCALLGENTHANLMMSIIVFERQRNLPGHSNRVDQFFTKQKIFEQAGTIAGATGKAAPGVPELLKGFGKVVKSAYGAYSRTYTIWKCIEVTRSYKYELLHRDKDGWKLKDTWVKEIKYDIIKLIERLLRMDLSRPYDMAVLISEAKEKADAEIEKELEEIHDY